tara:strand:- start:3128 stop:3343 length:216 start_codon:yes stop_codon:yes gene_type:complete
MNIEITRDEKLRINGFNIIPDHENQEDVYDINELRNFIFYSLTHKLKYDGRTSATNECAGTLKFRMKEDEK